MVAKRKVSTPLTPPLSVTGSLVTITSSRRSSRAVPRKSYAQADLVNDPDVYDDPLDREASPDQTSELSAPPSVLDHSEPPSGHDEANFSEDSLIQARETRVKKKPKIAKKTGVKNDTKPKVASRTVVKKEQDDTVEFEDEEDCRENEDEDAEAKPVTKASKFRERDARAAEKYAEFEERPPTFDSEYVPIPFKGRLGYACLNTILRSRKEPVFCSRTTRIATIAKEDKGMPFVLELGRQNAADLSKMLEWNEKYNIRFFRLSSEMFPFASHPDYLYNLEHADAELRAAGAVANQYDHRVSVHPGQFTQIASPNPKIFDNAVRDLEFHNELLTRMNLQPAQRDRDAVMILHLGGAYGDKPATLDRFRTNYARLSPAVKQRLVLENDDMSWSVTDLLPLCQELNIPLVLDWHHHNIVRDEEQFREGSLDIIPLLPVIAETWSRKGIKQKMHISEPRLPNHPLPSKHDMDIMIEAKDKEQAVFELAKAYNLSTIPLPAEVVGDGPGAKGDEAYWPEGHELRLKTTKTRVKKEIEYDSDGKEIKPKPKSRKKVKEEEQEDEDEHVQAKTEMDHRPEDHSPPDQRRRSGRTSTIKQEETDLAGTSPTNEQETEAAKEPALKPVVPARKRTRSKKESKEEGDPGSITTNSPEKVKAKTRKNQKRGPAASQTELDTGLTAKELVDNAVKELQIQEQLRVTKPAQAV